MTLCPLVALAAVAGGPVGPLPPQAPAPLLFVRLSGPPGAHFVFYQGAYRQELPAPVIVGIRPGYICRVEMTGLEGRRELSLFPTLEVRGSLRPPPKVNPAAFPAPVNITDQDVIAAVQGALITKVVYVESPYRAAPMATPADEPLVTQMPARADLLAEAHELGRPVLVLRLGQRPFTQEEMACQTTPGTILLPGMGALGPPAGPPQLPVVCWPWYDPIHGPRGPEEEVIRDGGDQGLRAGIGPDGRAANVGPEDTVAEYVDSTGTRRLVCSNRVCLYAPRFAVLRTELPPWGVESVVAVGLTRRTLAESVFAARQRPQQLLNVEMLASLKGRQRPSITEQVEGPVAIAWLQNKPEVVVARVETREVVGTCKPPELLVDKPLCLEKCADRVAARQGDIVTFTLRYSNRGQLPMSDVAITDSLTTRLEYVQGSARSDRDAVFTTQENEVGSLILRWEISGVLQPGSVGYLTFQARVR
jgi:uncharacterized repeat protein (TIGR01451 family)